MPEFWVPLSMTEEIMPDLSDAAGGRNNRDNHWLMLNARLRPGVSRAKATVLVNVVNKRIDETYHKDRKQHESVTLTPRAHLSPVRKHRRSRSWAF